MELEFYLPSHPDARVTGIDLAPGMLKSLGEKFPGCDLELICGSYFDADLGKERFDAAVSVESLHHFTQEEKIPLYRRLHTALKDGGYFILTDYFSLTGEEETRHRQELIRLKAMEGIADGEFYHYDTPLTVEHEMEALKAAGFSRVEILRTWGATGCIRAEK